MLEKERAGRGRSRLGRSGRRSGAIGKRRGQRRALGGGSGVDKGGDDDRGKTARVRWAKCVQSSELIELAEASLQSAVARAGSVLARIGSRRDASVGKGSGSIEGGGKKQRISLCIV